MKEEGAALVLTFVVIMIISLLVISTLSIVGKESITAYYYQQELENQYLIKAAVEKAKMELKDRLQQRGNKDWRACDLEDFSLSDSLTIAGLLNEEGILVEYELKEIAAESGKANLNLLSREQLRRLSALGSILSSRIYQQRLEKEFSSLAELQMIEGIAAHKYQELKDLLAVREGAEININTAPRQVLLILDGIGSVKADKITTYRQQTPFSKIQDLKNVAGIGRVTYNQIRDQISTKSELFQFVLEISIPQRKTAKEVTAKLEVK
ncbi:MAG: helix-hairpin-helix domain-containing protein [Halanaerobacter sp.]